MLLISICSVAVPLPVGTGSASEPPCRDAEFLQGAQGRSGRSTDVVGSTLEAVELLHDGQRYHDVGIDELEHAGRIGDQHGGVDDEPGSLASLRPVVTR